MQASEDRRVVLTEQGSPAGSRDTAAEVAPGGIAPPGGWGYVPGLDGIRALAVLAVLAFHDGISAVGGGLLGVDIFFVLSGFLITSLLVSEWRRSGTISFRRFYERRARRLLPALVVTLLFVAVYAWFFADPGTRGTIRADAFSTMAYVANWRFIFSSQNYFVHFGAPSPLLHTWSLSVEEQFYLVWPALALFVLRRRGATTLMVVAAALAVLSAICGIVEFHAGFDASRLYYGTDVRIQEMMVGACLAAWWGGTQGLGHRRHGAHVVGGGARQTLRDRTLLGLGLLGTAVLLWALHAVDGSGGFLYQGGFLLVALSTVAVIATVVRLPRSLLARAFSVAPARYVGRISYGLYLYHWPIFLTLSGTRTHLHGPSLLTLRLVVTFAVAAASYHFIEEPIRRHHWFTARRLLVALPAVALLTIGALVLGTLPATSSGGATSSTTLASGSSGSTAPAAAALAVPAAPGPGVVVAPPVRVLLFGDSMAYTLGLGLADQANRWGVEIRNAASIGCDLLPPSLVRFQGNTSPRATGCPSWQTDWPTQLRAYRPAVVALGVGRWEVMDRQLNGTWYTIADKPLQAEITQQLNGVVEVAAKGGAKVVLFTLPYVQQTTTAPDGTPWDINQHWRTDVFNRLVRDVARQHPGLVTVIDENALLDPHGRYTSYIDGVRVRDTDEEHPSPAGGMLLRPVILPVLAGLGHTAMTQSKGS